VTKFLRFADHPLEGPVVLTAFVAFLVTLVQAAL